jgi:hypothetical protein
MLKPEAEDGNIEYKRFLINIDQHRFEQLSTQMNWRLYEGNNDAIYYIGVNDNGTLYKLTKFKIFFDFFSYSNKSLPNNCIGYFNNRRVYLSNIKKIDNYYNDGNIIIIDNDFIKGIIIINNLEYL